LKGTNDAVFDNTVRLNARDVASGQSDAAGLRTDVTGDAIEKRALA